MVTIALDAMGGDHFPRPEVGGALLAAKTLGAQVILVGREDVLRKELERHPSWRRLPIEIRHANELITMEDSAGKAIRKKDSSIRVACGLVRDGHAQGVVSAGNTGAVMATAKMVQGMLPGVDRPALATAFPTIKGKSAVILDVGANVDCTPKMLAQFAVMGNAYSRVIFRNAKPRVGLLSIGEEEHKGNSLTHDVRPLLKSLHGVNFIGNVEGRDLYTGKADVIVCDGFVGNVALKVSEGLVEVIGQILKQSLTATTTRKVGAFLAQGAFREFKKRVDVDEYGGAPLLGLNGLCVICHGRSNAKAIMNAIRVAKEFADSRIDERIAVALDGWAAAAQVSGAVLR
jgi:phosphate acyltransferase